jgi:hypothetical protein
MKQAIGRAKRFGQLKTVYVYRFAALNTIDVDILEYRERLSEPLWQYEKFAESRHTDYVKLSEKSDSATSGKTKLVRDAQGRFVLVPRRLLNLNEEEFSSDTAYTSLESFSQAFMEDTFDD